MQLCDVNMLVYAHREDSSSHVACVRWLEALINGDEAYCELVLSGFANLVADAYLAAIAIESGCEWITTDRDFTRFQGLRMRSPLSQA